MDSATRVTVSTMGVIAGLAGLEHGIGEVVQGSVTPDGFVILSWPHSAFFSIMAGEPAATIVPNLFITGVLAILLSLIFLVWATRFVQRKNGGLVMLLICIAWFLVGGGFGPPLLGLILSTAAARINTPLTWWQVLMPGSVRRFVGMLWPWTLRVCVVAWLLLMPGLNLLDSVVGLSVPRQLFYTIILMAFTSVLLAIVTALVHDAYGQIELHPASAMSS